jgi:hypothetical protein
MTQLDRWRRDFGDRGIRCILQGHNAKRMRLVDKKGRTEYWGARDGPRLEWSWLRWCSSDVVRLRN